MPKDLRVVETADALGISQSTLLKYVNYRGCPADRTGRRMLFDLAEVQAWMAKHALTGRSGKPTNAHLAAARAKALWGSSNPLAKPKPDAPRRVPRLPAAPDAPSQPARPEAPPGLEDVAPRPGDSADTLILKEALAKARQTWWRASLDKLKALQAEGKLVEKEEVLAAHAQAVERAKAALLALPSIAAPILAPESNTQAIERHLDGLIREILRGLATE